MQAIEPVVVPEATERALLTDQAAVDFPASSSGQPATVTLQVLVGRDGTVVKRYAPVTKPDAITSDIEKLL